MMNASVIIGKEVLDKNAIRIGKVVDIALDIPQGKIDHLIVKAGLTKKLYIPVSNIETAGDRVILNLVREELDKSSTPIK
jgi:sporulation protein YlmC with PRC-barrel domain